MAAPAPVGRNGDSGSEGEPCCEKVRVRVQNAPDRRNDRPAKTGAGVTDYQEGIKRAQGVDEIEGKGDHIPGRSGAGRN
ncbi:MAG: hypothetical protein JWP26_1851 [Devosia sp.]|nr:hypothetical protein [Devosia sp.]